MQEHDALPFDQARSKLLSFGFSLLSNAAVLHLSQQDMMESDNVLAFQLSVDDHCKYDQNQWEWEQ